MEQFLVHSTLLETIQKVKLARALSAGGAPPPPDQETVFWSCSYCRRHPALTVPVSEAEGPPSSMAALDQVVDRRLAAWEGATRSCACGGELAGRSIVFYLLCHWVDPMQADIMVEYLIDRCSITDVNVQVLTAGSEIRTLGGPHTDRSLLDQSVFLSIRSAWNGLLEKAARTRAVSSVVVEPGYRLVARPPARGAGESAEFDRAVSRQWEGHKTSAGALQVALTAPLPPGVPPAESYLGWAPAAAPILRSGDMAAFAFGDLLVFTNRLRDLLAREGWTWREEAGGLRITKGEAAHMLVAQEVLTAVLVSGRGYVEGARCLLERLTAPPSDDAAQELLPPARPLPARSGLVAPAQFVTVDPAASPQALASGELLPHWQTAPVPAAHAPARDASFPGAPRLDPGLTMCPCGAPAVISKKIVPARLFQERRVPLKGMVQGTAGIVYALECGEHGTLLDDQSTSVSVEELEERYLAALGRQAFTLTVTETRYGQDRFLMLEGRDAAGILLHPSLVKGALEELRIRTRTEKVLVCALFPDLLAITSPEVAPQNLAAMQEDLVHRKSVAMGPPLHLTAEVILPATAWGLFRLTRMEEASSTEPAPAWARRGVFPAPGAEPPR